MTVRNPTDTHGPDLAYDEAPAPRYSRPLKRSDALHHVAGAAASLCDALAAVAPPAGPEWQPVALAHGGLAHALDELARARGRTPGTMVVKAPGPRTEKDARGYQRAASTQPGSGQGRRPANLGQTYAADPPTPAEIIALLHGCEDTPAGRRRRAAITVAWRTAVRVSELLAITETDLHQPSRGAIIIRHGKGDKRRIVGMDPWAWESIEAWLEERRQYPRGPLFCVLAGPTAGRRWSPTDFRRELHALADRAGVRRRVAPHQFRHAWTLERMREGVPLPVIQRQLGHSNLAVTSTYTSGLSVDEIVNHAALRAAPAVSVPDLMGVLRVAR